MSEGVGVSGGGGQARSRLSERSADRARHFHTMRGGIMIAFSIIVVLDVLAALMVVALILTEHPFGRVMGPLYIVLSAVISLVVLFLAWMTLEALGRIERETERVQQFMDNVYRRLS
ncbi:MAG TPA: hypothetical protein VNZ52_06485 [Candidatus Thermoplasmatota archaeon]|nr:hypothetical protein [Candidatus Thermoplasmatota archaeon]